jgi:hypothetical protein
VRRKIAIRVAISSSAVGSADRALELGSGPVAGRKPGQRKTVEAARIDAGEPDRDRPCHVDSVDVASVPTDSKKMQITETRGCANPAIPPLSPAARAVLRGIEPGREGGKRR